MSCLRAGRKKGSCVSLKTTELRGESHKDIACLSKHAETNTRMSVQACPPHTHAHLHPTTPHAPNGFFSKQRPGVFVLHYNIIRKRDESDWERREECCSKSQEGGIYVDVGELHHPPSLAFLLLRGSRGPHNHCLIITSMEGMCVCVCVLGGMQKEKEKKTEEGK